MPTKRRPSSGALASIRSQSARNPRVRECRITAGTVGAGQIGRVIGPRTLPSAHDQKKKHEARERPRARERFSVYGIIRENRSAGKGLGPKEWMSLRRERKHKNKQKEKVCRGSSVVKIDVDVAKPCGPILRGRPVVICTDNKRHGITKKRLVARVTNHRASSRESSDSGNAGASANVRGAGGCVRAMRNEWKTAPHAPRGRRAPLHREPTAI
mmetsp:Transcript_39320/g.121579  ORF Transcript_39320/g.121579 Transcript_39320/m.121579 type:complete len:213 (+) Transcript_39320:375-1013(+)